MTAFEPFAFVGSAKHSRFGEPAKFLPVIFVTFIIAFLWSVYMRYHCFQLMSVPETMRMGLLQMIVFNVAAVMLVVCYVKSILTQPGSIPEDEGSDWNCTPQDLRRSDVSSSTGPGQTETKKSGDRRYCKWCAKYKPDRCHHCRVCRTCVLRMDHHCPWIFNCVGFRNHKYFFLLLFYSVFSCHFILWTMYDSLKASMTPETPFSEMFALLLGETLAALIGFLATAFFCFHVWLMLKGMTTIEWCEKSMKHTGYNSHTYDHGIQNNIRSALGDYPLLWLLPLSPPSGDGLRYESEKAPLLNTATKDVDTGRAMRKKLHEPLSYKPYAGTGEYAGSDGSGTHKSGELDDFSQDEGLSLGFPKV